MNAHEVIAKFRTTGFLSHDETKLLCDSCDSLLAQLHHFYKYHAAESDAAKYGRIPLGQESWYLGTLCKECEFSRSQQRAIDENARLTKG